MSALRTLATLLALIGLTVGCKSDPPAPKVSVGTSGRPAAKAPPQADAGTPKADPPPKKAPEPPKTPEKAPTEAGKSLPNPAPGRLDYLQDASLQQVELLQAAKDAMAADNDPAARKAFERLQKTEVMSGAKVTGLIALADMVRADGDAKKAVTILEELYQTAPPMPEVVFVLARAYKESSRLEEAILANREALRLQPLMLQAHVEIGGLYQQLGQQDDATAALLEYERAVYKFSGIIEDPKAHPEDKIKIAEAFSFLPDDRAAPALVKALGADSDPKVRLAIIEAIGEIGTETVLPPLKAAMEAAGNPEEKQALRAAIAKITAGP